MDTFTLRLPRWLIVRIVGRNPLVRTSDRVQAAMLVLTVMVSLLAVPVAAAVGTAVHDSMRRFHTEQAQTRHTVAATVINDSAANQPPWTRKTVTVQARWFAGASQHTGALNAQPTAKAGDRIDVWVDSDGHRVDKPTPVSRAAANAVLTAAAIWLSVAAAAATLFALSQLVLDRIRAAAWQHDIDNLVGHGGGRTNSQP